MLYCTPSRHANGYTTDEIYHTHDLLYYSGSKYTNRYNTKEDAPTIYCTPSRHANGYTTEAFACLLGVQYIVGTSSFLL
jgi:hypothetical protein